tara:strand:- start:780 stop:1055 length:276 start_codon:yes stop_codon:yes gene_type:complete
MQGSSYFRPIALEVAAPTSEGASINVSKAQNVRIVNTHATVSALVTLLQIDGDTIIGTFSLAPGESVILNKKKDEELFAAAATVKFCSVAR